MRREDKRDGGRKIKSLAKAGREAAGAGAKEARATGRGPRRSLKT